VTCIVAVEHDGVVYMGSDRAGSDGWGIGTVAAAKTFRNGPLLIGYTTSFRMGQLLQYALVPPTDTLTWDVDRWVATDLMAAIREAYDAHGWDETESNKHVGGNFLLAVAGRAYEIQSNYSFIRKVTGEYAVGSGEMFALGSLHSTRDLDPLDRVRLALEAAAEMSPSVAGPFDYVTQESA
jgi:ATP-dependent protease HslVU (ClpYQ) peptidase subunit